jgi:hypothetical protein
MVKTALLLFSKCIPSEKQSLATNPTRDDIFSFFLLFFDRNVNVQIEQIEQIEPSSFTYYHILISRRNRDQRAGKGAREHQTWKERRKEH